MTSNPDLKEDPNASGTPSLEEEFPWSVEELSLPETWWLILQPSVNLRQVGGTTWNHSPTRPKPNS